MKTFSEVKHIENFHILLWLLKDLCWMQEWKILASIVFVPTLFFAIYICIKTYNNHLAFIVNLAVLCWISANSCWMFQEFFQIPLKIPATLFFGSGIIMMIYYLYQIIVRKQQENNLKK
jgi:hypothetical protein